MDITYEKCGDYLIPNLIPDPEPEGELRKFGLMRKSYLENHRRGIYSGLLLSGELKKHLLMIQEQAEERFDLLVEQMAKREGVTEQLKAQDQMLCHALMKIYPAQYNQIIILRCTRACLKNHSRDLYSPLCGEFIPNLVNIARYAS